MSPAALIVAVAVSQSARVEPAVPYFEVHSGFWQNLHHTLYELAQRQRVAEGVDLWVAPAFDLGTLTLSAEEQVIWKGAVDHYAKTWAEKDLLFDDDLGAIKFVLAAHENDATLSPDPDLPAETLKALNAAAPLYRRALWPKHDEANRRWLTEHSKDITETGPPVVAMLENAFDAKFPKAPIRLDLVAASTGGGAYTSNRGGTFIVASTLDPRDQGRPGTEILFHESSHAMMDAVRPALGPTAPKQLWHAVLFFTVGEAFRRQWPDYLPYYETQKIFPDLMPAVAAAWTTRLDGKPRLQVAADELLKKVGAPDPDVALARAQTVVTGTRTERRLEDAVVSTEVITRAQIQATGVQNLEQLLLQQPGVEIDYSFRGAGLSLQGLGSEYVLVLVDGVRQTGRVGNTLDLTRYSLRGVERIEITKGPAAALYGSDAIGGVINIITHRPQKPLELIARGGGGFTNAPKQGFKADLIDARGGAGTKLGWFEGTVGAGYQNYGAYDLDISDVATSGAGVKRWDVDGALAADLGGKVRVSASSGYLRRDQLAVDLSPTGAVFDRRQRSEQLDATVRADATVTEKTHLALWGHLGLFRDQLIQDQRGATFYDAYSASLDRLYSVDAQLDHRFSDNTLTVGAQFLREMLYSNRLAQLGERWRVGVFVQDEWDVPELGDVKVKVLPGLRVDVDSQFGSAPTPRLAVKMDPHPAVTLRASYGWGFRAPSFQELYLNFENTSVGYIVEGNSKLRAENSQGVNLAVDWRLPLEGWLASLSVFHTDLTDLIDIDTSAPIDPINITHFKYGNVASAYTQGLEASLRMRLSRGTYFDLGYTLLDARDTDLNRPLQGRSTHKISAQVSSRYRPLGLELMVRGTAHSPRQFYVGSVAETIRWMVVLDVQVTWHPFSWGSVFAGGSNLLNAGDAKWAPVPPRRITAGIQLEY